MIKLKMYCRYLSYVMEHKKNVFKACWNRRLYIHSFTHDLSKFSRKEFTQYANWFHGKYGMKMKDMHEIHKDDIKWMNAFGKQHLCAKNNFDSAWQHHKDNNKHHWNYWSERDMVMPTKYVKQMICDWEAMSIKFGDTPQAFYLNNYKKIELKEESRIMLEYMLGINESLVCNYGNTLETLINYAISDGIKKNCNYAGELERQYGVDLYKILGLSDN